jgi:hypothetical protein
MQLRRPSSLVGAGGREVELSKALSKTSGEPGEKK